jgi:hypothetical protein
MRDRPMGLLVPSDVFLLLRLFNHSSNSPSCMPANHGPACFHRAFCWPGRTLGACLRAAPRRGSALASGSVLSAASSNAPTMPVSLSFLIIGTPSSRHFTTVCAWSAALPKSVMCCGVSCACTRMYGVEVRSLREGNARFRPQSPRCWDEGGVATAWCVG